MSLYGYAKKYGKALWFKPTDKKVMSNKPMTAEQRTAHKIVSKALHGSRRSKQRSTLAWKLKAIVLSTTLPGPPVVPVATSRIDRKSVV